MSYIAMLLSRDEVLNFYALFPSQENTNIKHTCSCFIYKLKMHSKQEIDAQNLRQSREYYTLATSFRYAIGSNEIKGFIYPCGGVYL